MALRTQVIARFIQAAAGGRLKIPPALRFPDLRMAATKTHRVATEAGPVTCVSYHPTTTDGLPGVYVNFHGGGYLVRHPEQDDAWCRYLAHHTGQVVVNVDYDVAPQRPFPTAVLQAHGVCSWASGPGSTQGWDGARLAVGGQSAGGGLAAATSRLAREHGSFTPRLQVLLYPPLDLTVPAAAKTGRTAKPLISPGLAQIFDDAYTPDPGTRTDPLVSPATATDLAGLAPALILTAEWDTLRDEGDRYAAALAAAGVPVVHEVIAGVDHAFTHTGPVEPALRARRLVCDALAKALAPPG